MGKKGEGRQQWMCAAVSGVVSPLKVTLTCIVSAVGSSTTDAKPVAVEAVGGISFAAERLATKVIGIADASDVWNTRADISNNAGVMYLISALPLIGV